MAVRRRRGGHITSRTPPLQPHLTFYVWLEFLSSTTDYETQAALPDRRRSETLPLIGIITFQYQPLRWFCLGHVFFWDKADPLFNDKDTTTNNKKSEFDVFWCVTTGFCVLVLAYHPLNTWS